MTLAIVLMLLVAAETAQAPPAPDAPQEALEGQPFGPTSEESIDGLFKLAKSHGLDLEGTMKQVYKGDQSALAKVYALSSRFTSLDPIARVYGNMLFTTLLNVGESRGVDFMADVLSSQDATVRQRVRDFLYYPVLMVEVPHRPEAEKQTRAEFPKLFPPDYEFGKNDPMFK